MIPTHRFALARFALAPAFLLLLAGCNGGNPGDSSTVFRHFSIDDGNVAVHSGVAADAIINAAGEMTIAGKAVDTNPAQRQLLAHYHDSILQLRSEAVAVGKAGIKTAAKAIGSVVAGLASGTPDKIGDKVDAQARMVESRVEDLCTTLREVRTAQEAIAVQLAAFRPYATIDADEVDHCR